MAEQDSHNVVKDSQSTSASALVDVAANQVSTASAEHGSQSAHPAQDTAFETKPVLPDSLPAANSNAIRSNTQTSSVGAEPLDLSGAKGDVEETAFSTAIDNNVPESGHTAQSADVTDDASLREGSVDISVNSDTEGSRGDASEAKKDDKHHVRTNSVKKPLTFSKVSVTKNFLAKSVTTVPPVAKPGERPSPAGTPPQPSAAKPRLIAKVGTSLRDVQKARLTADATAGPDASKVWNKNRPVPPPPPKQFTDEELKQQYGIHLATRLQTDEEGKQSKWADIDDDEEDWAPDTVEWMDGTKSTLMSHETQQLPQKDLQAPLATRTKPDIVRPMLIVKKPSELAASMTVLKPGANAAATQARQGEQGAGALSDKASERTSAALPAKSPWAVLPPVDRVSPVNPPVQQRQPPPPFASQDARVLEQLPPPPPAREIAADTFDRSWREGEGGTRELFNSANGRYEPVPEGRRGSNKPDTGHRKPSVLQRPSPSAPHPAEPSAAFQTRSANQHDTSWTRRRGSSVSQSSFPQGRRVSTPKTSEASPAPERRGSIVISHDVRASPSAVRADPMPPTFSQQSAWQQQMPSRPDEGTEDKVKAQERIMREKREEARKRHDEEARLETEKQERLKAKLASLAGAGKSRKEREAEAAAASTAMAISVGNLTDKSMEPSALGSSSTERMAAQSESAEAFTTKPPAADSAVISPVGSAEAKQVEQAVTDEPVSLPDLPKQVNVNLPDQATPSADQAQRQQSRTHLSPATTARAPFQQAAPQFQTAASTNPSPGDRKQQPFERSPLANTNTFSPWPTTAPTGSVWGTSGIGNGTFESSNVFAPVPMSQQSSLPPPPGMSRPTGATRISPQSLASDHRTPHPQQQAVVEPSRGFGPPGIEPRADVFANQGRVGGVSPAPGLGRQTHLPGPIAPPSRAHPQSRQQQSQRPASLAAWNNAVHTLPYQYTTDIEAAELRANEAMPALPHENTFRETFKQTSATQGPLGGPRRFEKSEYTIHDSQGSRSVPTLSPTPPISQTQPPAPASIASTTTHDLWRSASDNTVRLPDGSLNPAHGGLQPRLSPIGPASQQANSTAYQAISQYQTIAGADGQAAPPPETMSHPVYSGEGGHPHVRLPPKKPTVKLPPSQVMMQPPQLPQHTPAMPPRPAANWGPPGSSRPLVMQEAWQARFNGLFGRAPVQTETPPSPPKTPPKLQGPALAVSPSSRAVMDETSSNATVALPPSQKVKSPAGFTLDNSADVVSKGTIEHIFNGELSMGSKPRVLIPKRARYMHSHLTTPPSDSIQPLLVEAQSQAEFKMFELHARRREGVFVHLPTTRLVRRLVKSHRKPSGPPTDRKASGRFQAKAHGNGMNGESGTPPQQGRKASSQKTSVPATSSSAAASPLPPKETSRKAAWAAKRNRGPAAVQAA